jgi:hypothetical protein
MAVISPTLTQQEVQNQVWASEHAAKIAAEESRLAASGVNISVNPSFVYGGSGGSEKVAVASVVSQSQGEGNAPVFVSSPSTTLFEVGGKVYGTPVEGGGGQVLSFGSAPDVSLKEATGLTPSKPVEQVVSSTPSVPVWSYQLPAQEFMGGVGSTFTDVSTGVKYQVMEGGNLKAIGGLAGSSYANGVPTWDVQGYAGEQVKTSSPSVSEYASEGSTPVYSFELPSGQSFVGGLGSTFTDVSTGVKYEVAVGGVLKTVGSAGLSSDSGSPLLLSAGGYYSPKSLDFGSFQGEQVLGLPLDKPSLTEAQVAEQRAADWISGASYWPLIGGGISFFGTNYNAGMEGLKGFESKYDLNAMLAKPEKNMLTLPVAAGASVLKAFAEFPAQMGGVAVLGGSYLWGIGEGVLAGRGGDLGSRLGSQLSISGLGRNIQKSAVSIGQGAGILKEGNPADFEIVPRITLGTNESAFEFNPQKAAGFAGSLALLYGAGKGIEVAKEKSPLKFERLDIATEASYISKPTTVLGKVLSVPKATVDFVNAKLGIQGVKWQEAPNAFGEKWEYAGELQKAPKVSGSLAKDYGTDVVGGVTLAKSAVPLSVKPKIVDTTNVKPELYEGFVKFEGEMVEAPAKPVTVYRGLTFDSPFKSKQSSIVDVLSSQDKAAFADMKSFYPSSVPSNKVSLFGLSETGNVVIGRFPTAQETPALRSFRNPIGSVDVAGNVKYRPSSNLEASFLTQPSVVNALDFSIELSPDIIRAKNVMSFIRESPSDLVRDKKLPIETKTATPKLTATTNKGIKLNEKLIREEYGSYPTQSLVAKPVRRMAGDAEAAFEPIGMGAAQSKAIEFAFNAKIAGAPKVKVEGLTVSYEGVKGKEAGHALDFHMIGEETKGSGSESMVASNEAYGFDMTGKYTKVGEFSKVVDLPAQTVRKAGDSIASWRKTPEGKLVAQPAKHRIGKEEADVYQYLKSTEIDYSLRSKNAFDIPSKNAFEKKAGEAKLLAEDWKARYTREDYPQGFNKKTTLELQATLKEKFAEVDAGVYTPSKPAPVKLYPDKAVGLSVKGVSVAVGGSIAGSSASQAGSFVGGIKSVSRGQSLSSSKSPSISNYVSPSLSVSPSKSPSVSMGSSVSVSKSPSVSMSSSPSLSKSPSVSLSPSMSPSVSPSRSPSVSISPSISPSVSHSKSPSVSMSPSISPSKSSSVSVSPSPSISKSPSPSPYPSLSSFKSEEKKSKYKFVRPKIRKRILGSQGVTADYLSRIVSQAQTGRVSTPKESRKGILDFKARIESGKSFFPTAELQGGRASYTPFSFGKSILSRANKL